MEAVGAAEDMFYEEEAVNCYDFEPLPTLLEDEVSEAGAGTEPPPPLGSPVVRRPSGAARGRLLLPGRAGPRRQPDPGGSPAPPWPPGRVDIAVRLPCVRCGSRAFSRPELPGRG